MIATLQSSALEMKEVVLDVISKLFNLLFQLFHPWSPWRDRKKKEAANCLFVAEKLIGSLYWPLCCPDRLFNPDHLTAEKRVPISTSVMAGGQEGGWHPSGCLKPSPGSKGCQALCRFQWCKIHWAFLSHNCYFLNSFLQLSASFRGKIWAPCHLNAVCFLFSLCPFFLSPPAPLFFCFACICVHPFISSVIFSLLLPSLQYFIAWHKSSQKQGMKICHVNIYKNVCSRGVGVPAKPDHFINVSRETCRGDCMVSNQKYQGTKFNDCSRSFQFSFIFSWTISSR